MVNCQECLSVSSVDPEVPPMLCTQGLAGLSSIVGRFNDRLEIDHITLEMKELLQLYSHYVGYRTMSIGLKKTGP